MGDFCYWEAKSLEDCIIVYLNILITSLLAALAFRYFSNTTAKLRRRVIIIYIGVGLWVVTSLIKDLYSVIIYHSFVSQGQFSNSHSKIFAILDTPPAVIVQTLFLAIPYMMWKNVMRILSTMQIERTLVELQFMNFFTFYITIRFVILVLPWIALIIIPESGSSGANFVKLAMQLIDSLICNILLLGSLTAFLKRFQQIKIDSEEDKRKLKLEYSLMAICSSFRFLIDLGFLVILPQFSTAQCISPIFSLGYTLGGGILMHFLPIWIVLYIYKPNETVIEVSDTLSNG